MLSIFSRESSVENDSNLRYYCDASGNFEDNDRYNNSDDASLPLSFSSVMTNDMLYL